MVQYWQLVLQSAPNQSRIFGIEVCTAAFIKYMSIIRLGVKRCNNLGLKHYDKQFCLMSLTAQTS